MSGEWNLLPLRHLLAVIGLGLSLAACSLPRGAALQSEILAEQNAQSPSFAVVPVTRVSAAQIAHWPDTGWSGGYRWLQAGRGPDSALIQTGDDLEIFVWDAEENSLLIAGTDRNTAMPAMRVSSSGDIFMPYVGKMAVRGMTADAARDLIQDRLGAISSSAQVQVRVTPGRNHDVDLVGGVADPGRYALENRDTGVLSVLAMGGGIDPGLRHPLVRLLRGTHSYEIRAERLLADPAANVALRGGDKLAVVEDTRSFNALGAAGSEKVIYFETEHMSAMQALSAMGGLADGRADPKGVLILRDYTARQLGDGVRGPAMRQVVFTLDLTSADGLFAARQFRIHPDDTIIATESAVTDVRTVLGLFGSALGMTVQANSI